MQGWRWAGYGEVKMEAFIDFTLQGGKGNKGKVEMDMLCKVEENEATVRMKMLT